MTGTTKNMTLVQTSKNTLVMGAAPKPICMEIKMVYKESMLGLNRIFKEQKRIEVSPQE